ncbi:MAG TPA: efflux RND transporter permease subunit [Thiotrichaceae bacterium]|jgi:CzcA family heavy metal efflux pump|nr:efflux RND transporter permease subunit [Thiotrichaceae bacterium]HIM07966.1 efflux RND transporter permease subunit [Gammaproteobacteria bacterium]
MLAALVRFAINFRGVVIAMATLLMIYSVYRLSRAGLDIFPEFSPNLIVVQTEAPGYSTEQVEILVTRPIETALSGLIGIDHVRSESIQGLSVVNIYFEEDTDIYRNRQLLSERLAGLTNLLPEGVGPAVPVPMASSSATILTMGVTSSTKNLMELRSVVDWNLIPTILSVPGVADVNVFGGEIKQLQIQIDENKLREYDLGINEIVVAAKNATGIFGAGFIENSNQRLTLSLTGLPDNKKELEQVVVKHVNGVSITLSDVATIAYGAEPAFGKGSVMGQEGVVLMVIGQYGANTLNVSNAVEESIEGLGKIFSENDITLYPTLFRPANYIERSVSSITSHLIVGGLFVIIVLAVFMFNFRTAFISVMAIPLSLLTAILILLEMGVNLNIMVIGGLAIALGEVVDDAIIDTENIFRRLRQNKLLNKPLPMKEVVYNASMEVRGSVVYASFIVALVFVPLLNLSGITGRLFEPLGMAYILSIMMSLLVALTITPALCYLFLAKDELKNIDPPLIKMLQPLYAKSLTLISQSPYLVLLSTALFCVAGLSVLPGVGGQFIPNLREGHYIVHTSSISGTSLKESLRVGNQVTKLFLDIPGVTSVSLWSGRAERGADTFGSHYSEYEVDLDGSLSGSEQQQVLDAIRHTLNEFPGLRFEAHNFLSERIHETISGYTTPIVVNVYGNDLDSLDRKATEVAEVMKTIEGASGVLVQSSSATPLLQIALKLDKLKEHGLAPLEIVNSLKTAFEGLSVAKYQEDNRIFDVTVTLPEEKRQTTEDVRKLPIKTAGGLLLPLEEFADIRQQSGRYNILHQDGQRLQSITSNVVGRDIVSFMEELESTVLEKVTFNSELYPEFTGAAIEQEKAKEELLILSLLVMAVVMMLIYIAIGSFRNVILMMVNLPFALVGGVIAVLVTGGSLSVGSLVGFVTLFGITIRNSIMLASHYQFLVQKEGLPWNLDVAIQGAQERLPSILMTALVTALAMLPIAINSDNPGREIMGPMAAIIIGGLASSTILNLLIMPTIMLKFGKFKQS